MLKVYIAGPLYSGGKEAIGRNIRTAIDAADRLMNLGFAVYCPHLSHLHDILHSRPWQDWLKHDGEWLALCHALLRLPGQSDGADREVAMARSLGIPVFHDETALSRWATTQLVEEDRHVHDLDRTGEGTAASASR